jgi:hypothetical protein
VLEWIGALALMAAPTRTVWPRRLTIVPLLLLAMANRPSLPPLAKFSPARAVALVCTASGAQNLRPAATSTQVCAAFKRRFDAALGRDTHAAARAPASGDVISVALNIPGPRGASAAVTTRAGGRSARWPEISIDVMDKPLGMSEIEQLAAEVARTIMQVR